MNTKIYMGNGSLEILKKLAIKRAYIICDPFMKQSGRAEEIGELLAQSLSLIHIW